MNAIGHIRATLTPSILAATALLATSCNSIMDGEDLSGCPTGEVVVQFAYDYNIQRADMFRDHVGEVTLFVFDEADNLVLQRTENNIDAIRDRNNRFNMKLYAANTPGIADLVAGQKYRFVAIAGQKAGAIVPTTEGMPKYIQEGERSLYRRTSLTTGVSKYKDLCVALDRNILPGKEDRLPVSNVAPLDTLWHTLGIVADEKAGTWEEDHLVKIRENITDSINVVRYQPEDTITISLIRDTNHLHVTLNELDGDGDVKDEDYDVYITDCNGVVNYRNEVLTDDDLVYLPYAQRTTKAEEGSGVVGSTAHFDMMFNRIMFHQDIAEDARLYVVNNKTNLVVARLSLPRVLADSRIANEYYNLTQQGYLDREYNYHLNLYLKNGRWEATTIWINLGVHVMSFAIRTQDVEVDA